jgi:uncharacterized protein YndB with AHSA1/START domain
VWTAAAELHITRQLQRISGELLHSETKTEGSASILPLPDICLAALKLRRQEHDQVSEFDFRVGGRELFTTREEGTTYRYDGRYHDIVADNRIVYSYEMYADGARISVSVATIEFAQSDCGTRLIWTEQGVYLDGYNGAEAPEMRKDATIDMLNGLAAYLQRQERA